MELGLRDNLLIQSHGLIGSAINVMAIVKRQDGSLQFIKGQQTVSSDASLTETLLGLGGEGHLLCVAVEPEGTAPYWGQTLVRIALLKGESATAQAIIRTLIEDYLSRQHGLSWPPVYGRHSVEGPGMPVLISVTDPAVGANLTYTVPTNVKLRFLSLRLLIVTSAVAGNRTVKLIVDNGTDACFGVACATTIPASTTQAFSFISGTSLGDTVSDYNTAMPSLIPMPQGWRTRTSIGALDAADAVSGGRLYALRWIEE